MNLASLPQVAAKRRAALMLMPDTCNVIAGTITDDGFGGQIEDWASPTTVVSGSPCYYSEALTEDEQEQVNRRGLVVIASIHLPALTPVEEGHRIVLTATVGDHDGTYQVVGLTRYSVEATRSALVGKVG